MKKDTLQSLFRQLPDYCPETSLRTAILEAQARQSRSRRAELFLLRMVMVMSFVVLAYGAYDAGSTFSGSEFGYLVSLAFSDISFVIANGQDFLLSLLETFPFVPFFVSLVSLSVLAVCARLYVLLSLPRYSHQ